MSDFKVKKTIQDSTAVGEAAASRATRRISGVSEHEHNPSNVGDIFGSTDPIFQLNGISLVGGYSRPIIKEGANERKSKSVHRKRREADRGRSSKPSIAKKVSPFAVNDKRRHILRLSALKMDGASSDLSTIKIQESASVGQKLSLSDIDLSDGSQLSGKMLLQETVTLSGLNNDSSVSAREVVAPALQDAVRSAALKQAVINTFAFKSQYRHAIVGSRAVSNCATVRLAIKMIGRAGFVSSVRSASRSLSSSSKGMCLSACAMTSSMSGAKAQGMLAMRMLSGQDSATKTQQVNKAESNLMLQSGRMLNGRGKQSSQASPRFSSAKMLNMLSRRNSAQINSALWCPSDAIDQQGPYSPSIPTDDELFSVIAILEREAGEILVTKIVEQLQLGPAEIENDSLLRDVNVALPERYDPISHKDWKLLVQKTLNLAIRQVKIFTDDGIRRPEEIYEDAIELLELDQVLFAEWETFFGINGIIDNLMDAEHVSSRENEKNLEDFIGAIEKHLAAIASGSIETGNHRAAHEYLFEIKCQWLAARYSDIRDKECKIARTVSFISGLVKRDRVAAGMVLGLIVRHSVISGNRPIKGALVQRWRVSELRSLLAELLEVSSEIVSDVSFRSMLTSEQNESINELLYRINYGGVMDKLSEMEDVVIDKCLKNIEKADSTGKVFREIIIHMLENHEKFKSSE